MDSNAKQRDRAILLRKRELLMEAHKYAAAIFVFSGEALNAIDLLPEIEHALSKRKAPEESGG